MGNLDDLFDVLTEAAESLENASKQDEEIKSDQLPSQVDERQMSLFGAGWTLGSLKYLCESCPQSLTYYETTGWRGVMETKHSSPVSKLFNLLHFVLIFCRLHEY